MAYQRPREAARGYPYWVIVDRRKGSVWVGDRESPIFPTLEAARAEYDFQVAAMKQGMRTNYRVERVDAPGSAPAAREGAKRAEVDSFEAVAAASMPYKE